MNKSKFHIDPKGLTAEQIKNYLEESLSPSEMHAVENYLLNNSFDTEAMEGFEEFKNERPLEGLALIESRLKNRISPSISPWWRKYRAIAAGLALLISGGILAITIQTLWNEPSDLSINEKGLESPAPKTEIEEESKVAPIYEVGQEDPKEVKNGIESKEPTSSSADKSKIAASGDQGPSPAKPIPSTAPEEEIVLEEEITDQRSEGSLDYEIDIVTGPAETNPRIEIIEKKEKISSNQTAFRKRESLGYLNQASSPPETIWGRVTLEDGTPVSDINVLLKGTTIETKTNFNGEYKLSLKDSLKEFKELKFEYPGFYTREITMKDKREYNVTIDATGDILTEEDEFLEPTQVAQPIGGWDNFQKYSKENLIYPQGARKNNIKGRVLVEFVVGTNGVLSDFKVIKSLGFGCDEEAIRLIKEGPNWRSANRNGLKVKDKVRVRLKFNR